MKISKNYISNKQLRWSSNSQINVNWCRGPLLFMREKEAKNVFFVVRNSFFYKIKTQLNLSFIIIIIIFIRQKQFKQKAFLLLALLFVETKILFFFIRGNLQNLFYFDLRAQNQTFITTEAPGACLLTSFQFWFETFLTISNLTLSSRLQIVFHLPMRCLRRFLLLTCPTKIK